MNFDEAMWVRENFIVKLERTLNLREGTVVGEYYFEVSGLFPDHKKFCYEFTIPANDKENITDFCFKGEIALKCPASGLINTEYSMIYLKTQFDKHIKDILRHLLMRAGVRPDAIHRR